MIHKDIVFSLLADKVHKIGRVWYISFCVSVCILVNFMKNQEHGGS